MLRDHGKSVRVMIGTLYGERSPLATTSETVFADATLDPGAELPIDASHEERALYVVSGEIDIMGDRFGAHTLLVLRPGDPITLKATVSAHLVIVGGAPMDGPRYIWWNFVSSRKERIDAAKAEWRSGRFSAVPGETEFIPLPERNAPPQIM
jgi:redox-sensitive bicupin YhaK (pirin superfamily)